MININELTNYLSSFNSNEELMIVLNSIKIIDDKIFLMGKDGNFYSSVEELITANRDLYNRYNVYSSDNGKLFFTPDEALDSNREYWNNQYNKIKRIK